MAPRSPDGPPPPPGGGMAPRSPDGPPPPPGGGMATRTHKRRQGDHSAALALIHCGELGRRGLDRRGLREEGWVGDVVGVPRGPNGVVHRVVHDQQVGLVGELLKGAVREGDRARGGRVGRDPDDGGALPVGPVEVVLEPVRPRALLLALGGVAAAVGALEKETIEEGRVREEGRSLVLAVPSTKNRGSDEYKLDRMGVCALDLILRLFIIAAPR